MKRTKAERKIYEKALEIADIMRSYGAPSGYLSLCIREDGKYIAFNNQTWSDGADRDMPLDFWTGAKEEQWASPF